MNLKFNGPMIHWRGPAPFHFVVVPEIPAKKIKSISAQLTYGWGMVPVIGKIGKTEFSTALIPKDGLYYLPIKNQVRFAEELELEEEVSVQINLGS